MLKSGKGAASFTSPFCVKALLFGVLAWITLYPIAFTPCPLLELMETISHWACWTTTLFCFVSMKCSLDTGISKKWGWLTLHHLLFEITLPLNIVVTTVYWTMIREVALQTFAKTAIAARHSASLHSFPLISSLILFSVNDIVIKK